MTLDDVARAAGVSLATASRVLNGSSRNPAESLREKVLTAARALDYSPNANAQAIARGRTALVGLVVHDIADPYFSSIAAGAMQAAGPSEMLPMLAHTGRDPEAELVYLSAFRRQRARGVIVVGSRIGGAGRNERMAAELAAHRSYGGRVVMISQAGFSVDTAVIENRASARELADRVGQLGHREIAVLAGPRALRTSTDRLAGIRDGMARHGVTIPASHVVHVDLTRDGGADGGGRLVADGLVRRGDSPVTCVFAVTDVMAVGALAAFRTAGLRVPRDVSVAGFDDIPTAQDVLPTLTTVRLPLEDIGAQAMRMVLTDAPPDAEPRTLRFTGEVVLRDSVRSV